MWYKTKEGEEVFNTRNKGYFYQLTHTPPKEGEYILASVEHDPVHPIKIKSFHPDRYYPVNNNHCKFGAIPFSIDHFYGTATIRWTDNPNLEVDYQRSRNELYEYWSKKHSELTLDNF